MSLHQRIAISGASGLIGTALVGHLKAEGHTVQRLVRRAPVAADEVQWDPQTGFVDLEPLRGVDAVIHLAQAVLGAAVDGVEAKADPLAQNIAQRFLTRLTIGADHHQIDADTVFQRRMGEQQVTEFVLILIF